MFKAREFEPTEESTMRKQRCHASKATTAARSLQSAVSQIRQSSMRALVRRPRRDRTCRVSRSRRSTGPDVRPIGVLADGTAYYAPIGELVHEGGAVVCHLCGRGMRMIGGTHLRLGHGWTLEQYREAFHLPVHTPTCSSDLSDSYRSQAVARVRTIERFGQPPAPRASPRPARSRRWRSLAELHPELLDEVSSRNDDVDAAELVAGSHLKLWWRCRDCGHEWQASVTNRTHRASGCPRCAVRRRAAQQSKVDPHRSLGVVRPALAAELDPDRNEQLDVTTLGVASTRKVWWRCPRCDHAWETTVASRVGGTGCPACWNRRRSATFSGAPPERSLAQRAPNIALELHPDRNPPELDPRTLGVRSSRRVWWLCPVCGHEWQARVSDRAIGTRCPRCALNHRKIRAA